MDTRKHSQTSNLIRFLLSNSTSGLPLTGLTYSSSGLIISTITDKEATATAYTVAASNIETISTLGTFAAPTSGKCRFKEVDATNHPGLYEIQLADARFSVANAQKLIVTISGATNLKTEYYEIGLMQYNPYDSVRLGLTALPNATPGASGGLPTTNGTKVNQTVDLTANQSIAVSGDLSATMKNSVQTACDAALVAENLDHLCKVATAAVDMTAEVIDGSVISRIISNSDTSTFVPSSHNLVAMKTQLADVHDTADTNYTSIIAAITAAPAAVWNFLMSAMTTVESIGARLVEWLAYIPADASAWGATDLSLCNNALVMLGNEPVANLTDTTKKAVRICAQLYQSVVDETIRAYNWNCATARSAALTASTTPEFGYSYAFELPTDCLRVLTIEDDKTIPFKIEGGLLLTDESAVKITYLKRITAANMDSLLQGAISARLAARIAFPLTNSASLAAAMYKLYEQIVDEAQTMDAFEGASDSFGSDTLINSRL